ncbi:MAG: hypothetical protein ABIZ81_00795 [Opitutaceae bacterium]
MKRPLASLRTSVGESWVRREQGNSSDLPANQFRVGVAPFFAQRVARCFIGRIPRRVRSGLFFALWVSSLLISFVPAGAADVERIPAVDDKWRHYQSGNFELYSRNAEGESRDLLQNLELLRAVCLERFKFVERARLDVTVYYFRTAEDFRAYSAAAYAKNEFFKGYYSARADRAVIALAPTNNADADQRLIFHEYVHHLFRTAEEDPPAWFNEGTAEFLAGMRLEGSTIEIGRPHANRLRALQGEKLLPLETLFAVTQQSPIYRSSDHTGVFYAQSWALLHYWYCGDSNLPPEAVERFIRVASHRKKADAADLPALFRECFGFDYAEMQRRLRRYVESGSYRYSRQPAPKIVAASTYPMRTVSRDEIRTRLAELALSVNRAPMAKFILLEAIEKNPGDPRPYEALGMEALIDRDESGARDRWEQAVTAGTRNDAIFRELGLLESRSWFQQFNYYFRLAPEVADRLRQRLTRSIESSPQQSAAYEMLAWVEAYAETPSNVNVNLVQQHFSQLRQQPRTLLALAFVRVRVEKPDEARGLLDQLAKMELDPWTAQAAEVVRARLEGRPARRPAGVPATNRGPLGPVPRLPPVKAPAVDFPTGR